MGGVDLFRFERAGVKSAFSAPQSAFPHFESAFPIEVKVARIIPKERGGWCYQCAARQSQGWSYSAANGVESLRLW